MRPIQLHAVNQPQVVVGRLYFGRGYVAVFLSGVSVTTECDPDDILQNLLRNHLWGNATLTINSFQELISLNSPMQEEPPLCGEFRHDLVLDELKMGMPVEH